MHVETVVVGAFDVNCHILWGDDLQALVVDPGADPGRVARVLKKNKLSVERYLLTHGHCDHVSAAAALSEVYPAPVAIHPADAKWAFSADNSLPPYYGTPRSPSQVELLKALGESSAGPFRVMPTPGHTPGSVCFYFPSHGLLFSGDTLFAGSVGRTDLPGGNSRALAASLKTLAALPDETRVLSGHGPESTIAHEKATNYFLGNRSDS